MAKEALEKQGYELVPFEFTVEEIMEIKKLYLAFICSVFVPSLLAVINRTQEKLIKEFNFLFFLYQSSNLTRKLLASLLRASGNQRAEAAVNNIKLYTAEEIEEFARRKD